MVLAPHTDDETLGAAALIAQAVADDLLAGVVYLTDGVGSHPHADRASRARLGAARRTEGRAALRRLGAKTTPLFLDWPDAGPALAGSPAFEEAKRRLASLCRARRVDAIAVTAAQEPHCDHAAACELARAVACVAIRPLAVFEYVVWGEPPSPRTHDAFFTAPMLPGPRRAALAAHRSQLTPLLGRGFSLPAQQRRMADLDRLYRERVAHVG